MTQPTAPSPLTGTPYGTLPPASPLPQRRPVSLPRLQEMRDRGEKITMLTAYDATFADAILDRLVHHAHRIPLKGASMRREKRKPEESQHPGTP